jgi:hypothetical protein
MMKKLKQIVLLTTNANAIVWMQSRGFIESMSCLLNRWWVRYYCTNGSVVGISVLPPPQQFSETVLMCLHYSNINKLCLWYMQVPDSSHLIQALQASFLWTFLVLQQFKEMFSSTHAYFNWPKNVFWDSNFKDYFSLNYDIIRLSPINSEFILPLLRYFICAPQGGYVSIPSYTFHVWNNFWSFDEVWYWGSTMKFKREISFLANLNLNFCEAKPNFTSSFIKMNHCGCVCACLHAHIWGKSTLCPLTRKYDDRSGHRSY